MRLDFTMVLSGAEEVYGVREERLGSLWENLGLMLRANFLNFFYFPIVKGAVFSEVHVFRYVDHFIGISTSSNNAITLHPS